AMSYVVRPWALRDLKDVMRLIRVSSGGKRHTIVGYQFHYFRYCTWTGRIIFGEDLYVMPEFRGRGPFGSSVLIYVLLRRFMSANWNHPATALYEKLGAVDVTARDNWVIWHIEGQAVQEMAQQATQ
uniref:N-acetyltransferase domain-containing protein n=1 Tax=Gopherus agassizii TaxID=38772 RepID=A0A452I6G5_9SAUR